MVYNRQYKYVHDQLMIQASLFLFIKFCSFLYSFVLKNLFKIVNSKLTEGDTITMDLDEQKNNLTIKIKKGKKAKEKKTEAKD